MILRTIETGQGAPVLLLHGLFGQARNLGAIQRHFPDRRMVAMDLRNHGGSPHADGMRYADMAGDVRETAQTLGAWPAVLVGHSMGGKVAMRLALDDPETRALVVMDIAPVPYATRFEGMVRAMREMPRPPGMTRRQADAALADAVPDVALRGFLLENFMPGGAPSWRLGLDAIARGLPDIEGFDGAGRYDGPALFIAGAKSRYVRDAHHAAIATYFPQARIAACDTGHWLHAEDPACVCAHLERFFAEMA